MVSFGSGISYGASVCEVGGGRLGEAGGLSPAPWLPCSGPQGPSVTCSRNQKVLCSSDGLQVSHVVQHGCLPPTGTKARVHCVDNAVWSWKYELRFTLFLKRASQPVPESNVGLELRIPRSRVGCLPKDELLLCHFALATTTRTRCL